LILEKHEDDRIFKKELSFIENKKENKMNEFDIPNISYYSIRNSQDNNIIHTIFSFSLDMCRLGKSWNIDKNIIYEKI